MKRGVWEVIELITQTVEILDVFHVLLVIWQNWKIHWPFGKLHCNFKINLVASLKITGHGYRATEFWKLYNQYKTKINDPESHFVSELKQ